MSLSMNGEYSLKERYFLEPGFGVNDWLLRKEGSNNIVKRAKYKLMLLYFAESLLSNQKAELRICDSNGLLEDIIDFEKLYRSK